MDRPLRRKRTIVGRFVQHGNIAAPMSLMGQKRRFALRPMISGLPSRADLFMRRLHVSKVPMNEPASQERAARGAGGGDGVTR
jgi:hypothetical protein